MGAIRTLFVEDEPDIQMVVKLVLTRSDQFELTTFGSDVDALDILPRSHKNFDLALIDYNLSSMTGLDFMKRLRETPSFAHIPTILVTAMVIEGDDATLQGQNILGIIHKPFDILALPRTIQAMFDAR